MKFYFSWFLLKLMSYRPAAVPCPQKYSNLVIWASDYFWVLICLNNLTNNWPQSSLALFLMVSDVFSFIIFLSFALVLWIRGTMLQPLNTCRCLAFQ